MVDMLPLRLALIGYNQKTTELGLRYFIGNNTEQIEGVNWVGREIRLKDGTSIKGIISADELYLQGKRFDQLILFDDYRWEIEWHRSEDIRIIKALKMYVSIIPEEFQIIKYEYV